MPLQTRHTRFFKNKSKGLHTVDQTRSDGPAYGAGALRLSRCRSKYTSAVLFLSTNSSRLPSGEKLGESPAPTLCGTPPAVATTHTSLGIGPFGELLTLAGVSSSRLWPRVKAIDVVSGDQASSPISKPSSSVYGVIWRAFAPWEGSATQILRQPFASNTHATAAPVGAATM